MAEVRFVLGEYVEAAEAGEFTERDGQVRIRPLLYSSFLAQAEKRILTPHQRLQEALFLRDKGLVEFVIFVQREMRMCPRAEELSRTNPLNVNLCALRLGRSLHA